MSLSPSGDGAARSLDVLWDDGDRVFCRILREAENGERRAFLGVAPGNPYPDLASIRRLTHEYGLRDYLDAAWAVRPVGFERENGRPLLVLDFASGEPLDRLIGAPMEPGAFLRLAIRLAAAIRSLHERGLIHKDIKPANVLIDGDTGEIKLTGFGIASIVPRERATPEPPEFVAGTLPYMAPEQTGRINRSMDSRCDLYSLGVTLYEMLTGQLPFSAATPMEWVHCHIARMPVAPSERLPSVPRPLSGIVMRLLAKSPEDRYQTAAGLEHDLRHCLADWIERSSIAEFTFGNFDKEARLPLPEKLYGRDSEIAAMRASFERVAAGGAPELVLISGYSGTGKSALVRDFHQRVVEARGAYASGKFDQTQRDIPYASFAQAFQSLMRGLLVKSESELARWRKDFIAALDGDTFLIAPLVSALKMFVGEQAAPGAELTPQEEKARFHAAFERFIGVFARPDSPLVLFLDDLQWIDRASLDLIEELLAQPDLRHLMLIGAYRDNEVSAEHPLLRRIEAMRRAGLAVRRLALQALSQEDLTQLIADSLRCTPHDAAPLADLIQAKTAGNPFFAIQFVSALAEEGMLSFNAAERRWVWDLDRIRAKSFTDNVIDLMIARLNRLPAPTQEAIQTLACFGASAEATKLAIALEAPEEDVHAILSDGVRQELVDREHDTYGFIHDRVQEAAYSLVPEHRRAQQHLQIGRRLNANIPSQEREHVIFDIVNQLNRGIPLISDSAEREDLAALNLVAGERAKASAAYAAALNYFANGSSLLSEEAAQRLHNLWYTLELNRAECENLTGALTEAERRLAALQSAAADLVERASIACLRMDLYLTVVEGNSSIDVGLDYLKRLGISWPSHPTEEQVRAEFESVRLEIERYSIENLIALPSATTKETLATLDVLTKLCPALYNAEPNLLCFVICCVVRLSLEHGISDAAAVAYVRLGMIASVRFGEIELGYRLGHLAYELVERRGLKRYRPVVYANYANIILPLRQHAKAARNLIERARDESTASGDLVFAGVCHLQLNINLLFVGDPLGDIHAEVEKTSAFARKRRYEILTGFANTHLALTRTLQGRTAKFGAFDGADFDENDVERHFAAQPMLAYTRYGYFVRKLQARFFAGDYQAALDASSKASGSRLLVMLEAAEFHFYSALAHAASCDGIAPDEAAPHLAALAAHHRQLEIWAEHCAENFADRAALVAAEIARLAGRPLEAEELYERAIQSAHANGFIHNEALANELAARFYRARGLRKIADTYLRDARAAYLEWGAAGKVREIEESYPHLRTGLRGSDAAGSIGTPVEHLDLATVMNVSQAVSGEIILEKLIDTLMRTAIEQAGAERGLLILVRENEPIVEAEAHITDEAIAVHSIRTAPIADALPATVLGYVLRTNETLVIEDAIDDPAFSADPYIQQRRARSVLFLPLLNRSRMIGVLYLENNLAARVFAPSRIAVLRLLASQAAISLENTRLYAELAEREARIRRLVEANVMGIVIWERAGLVVEGNDAFLGMLGYQREDLVQGRIHRDVMNPPDWSTRSAEAWEELLRTGIVRPYEKEFLRKDGSRIPVLFGAASMGERGEKGIGFFVDLSEQKRAEDAARESERRLHEMQIELAHINRVVTAAQLSASIAHEINQPLAGIVTNASTSLRMLASDPPNLEGARETARRTIRDANRASEVIARLRALFAKRQTPNELVDLNDIVEEVLTVTLRDLQRRRVQLRTELAEDLAPVVADRVQLQQVIVNLLRNAADAMSGVAEHARRLLIRTSKDADGVLVTVQDSGPGIDPESLARIFDAFYSTKPGGLGIGLSICRTIIESHGGRLWAEAAMPQGAVLKFRLPVRLTSGDV